MTPPNAPPAAAAGLIMLFVEHHEGTCTLAPGALALFTPRLRALAAELTEGQRITVEMEDAAAKEIAAVAGDEEWHRIGPDMHALYRRVAGRALRAAFGLVPKPLGSVDLRSAQRGDR